MTPYEKMERWANRPENKSIKYFALGFIAWLRRVWYMEDTPQLEFEEKTPHKSLSPIMEWEEPSIEAQFDAFRRAAKDHDEIIAELNSQTEEE